MLEAMPGQASAFRRCPRFELFLDTWITQLASASFAFEGQNSDVPFPALSRHLNGKRTYNFTNNERRIS